MEGLSTIDSMDATDVTDVADATDAIDGDVTERPSPTVADPHAEGTRSGLERNRKKRERKKRAALRAGGAVPVPVPDRSAEFEPILLDNHQVPGLFDRAIVRTSPFPGGRLLHVGPIDYEAHDFESIPKFAWGGVCTCAYDGALMTQVQLCKMVHRKLCGASVKPFGWGELVSAIYRARVAAGPGVDILVKVDGYSNCSWAVAVNVGSVVATDAEDSSRKILVGFRDRVWLTKRELGDMIERTVANFPTPHVGDFHNSMLCREVLTSPQIGFEDDDFDEARLVLNTSQFWISIDDVNDTDPSAYVFAFDLVGLPEGEFIATSKRVIVYMRRHVYETWLARICLNPGCVRVVFTSSVYDETPAFERFFSRGCVHLVLNGGFRDCSMTMFPSSFFSELCCGMKRMGTVDSPFVGPLPKSVHPETARVERAVAHRRAILANAEAFSSSRPEWLLATPEQRQTALRMMVNLACTHLEEPRYAEDGTPVRRRSWAVVRVNNAQMELVKIVKVYEKTALVFRPRQPSVTFEVPVRSVCRLVQPKEYLKETNGRDVASTPSAAQARWRMVRTYVAKMAKQNRSHAAETVKNREESQERRRVRTSANEARRVRTEAYDPPPLAGPSGPTGRSTPSKRWVHGTGESGRAATAGKKLVCIEESKESYRQERTKQKALDDRRLAEEAERMRNLTIGDALGRDEPRSCGA